MKRWTEDQVRAAFSEMKTMIDCECSIAHPSEVKPIEIVAVSSPEDGCSWDDSGVGITASEIIRMLDRHYSREQVHAVAKWMLYLSTQS